MNILQIVPSLDNKAPVAFAFSLAQEMTKIGFRVDVCYLKKEKSDRIYTNGIECFALKELRHRLNDYQIIHSHMLLPNILSAFLFNKKRISTIHSDIWKDLDDSHGKRISNYVSKIWLLALNQNQRNICLTDYHYDLYRNRVNNRLVIPNGISYRAPAKELSCINGNVLEALSRFYRTGETLFSVGAFRKLKGLEQILLLLEKELTKRCVFFGDGPLFEELKDEAKLLGVEDRCLFLGFVENPYLYYKYCDCLLITSRSEGFPLSLLEVIRFKKPVVCSNIPTLENLFDGLIYKYKLDDISSLAKYVNISINDVEKVEYLYNIFASCYTSESISSRYISSYKEL